MSKYKNETKEKQQSIAVVIRVRKLLASEYSQEEIVSVSEDVYARCSTKLISIKRLC